jgi:hypothetical protein
VHSSGAAVLPTKGETAPNTLATVASVASQPTSRPIAFQHSTRSKTEYLLPMLHANECLAALLVRLLCDEHPGGCTSCRKP